MYECLFVCEGACAVCAECVSVSPSEFCLGMVKRHLDPVILIEHVSKANANVLLLGQSSSGLGGPSCLPSGKLNTGVKVRVRVCRLPREVFLPMLGMGLGMRPLPMPVGLVLFPGNRLCVGDVGERRASAVLGLAERFSGCVDPSSCFNGNVSECN